MYQKVFLCLVLFTGLFSAYSQGILDTRNFGIQEGLSNRFILFTTRSDSGFLWIVNSEIDFYDGKSFVPYNKFEPERHVPVSGIIGACSLWDSLLVVTDGIDLYALNMYTGKSMPWQYPEGMDEQRGSLNGLLDRQFHKNLLLMTGDQGHKTMHIVSREWKQLFSYTIKRNDPIWLPVMRLYAMTDDRLWILRPNSQTLVGISTADTTVLDFNLPSGSNYDNVRMVGSPGFGLLLIDRDGQVYAVRDGADRVEYLRQVGLQGNRIRTLHVSPNGMVWVICDERIIKFHPDQEAESRYEIEPFLAFSPSINNTFEDHEGILWVSHELGLLKIHENTRMFSAFLVQPEGQRHLQFRDILPAGENAIYAKALQDEKQLVELRFADNTLAAKVTMIPTVYGGGIFHLHDNDMYTIRTKSNDLWVFNLEDFSHRIIPLPHTPSTSFFNLFVMDDSGRVIYQNVNNNLSIYYPETGETGLLRLEHSDSLLNCQWRVMLMGEMDTLYIATEKSGVLLYSFPDGKLLRHYSTTTQPALSGDFVNALVVESGSILWAGTVGAGLNRIDLEKNAITVLTKKDGLPNNIIASILSDDIGNLWIGTYDGLSMYDKKEKTFYNFTTEDGLSNNEFNYRSAYKSGDGTMYMGTLNGITVFHPSRIRGKEGLPPVEFTRIRKYNRRHDQKITDEFPTGDVRTVRVSPYDNYIEFEFAIPSYISNTSHTFRTRLEGIDDQWQDIGETNLIRYQKLPPGRYHLDVMGLDGNGNQTKRPTSVLLVVDQIFYKSIWFIILLSGGILLLIMAFYRYRLHLLEKEHATRTRIASDLHDEVGGSLTGLSLQLQMMELNAPDGQKPHLNKVASVINESISKMRDLVWSIDARSDTWKRVIERMEDYASDTLSAAEKRFRFEVKGIQPDKVVNPKMKHNLYLIYKEAVHNIAKHSNATEVAFILGQKNGTLNMTILDNGQENGNASFAKGQGLENMAMRAERLKARIRAGFTPDGFKVELTVPEGY